MYTTMIIVASILFYLLGAATVYKIMTGMDSEAWRIFWSLFSWLFLALTLVILTVTVCIVKVADVLKDGINSTVDWLLEVV